MARVTSGDRTEVDDPGVAGADTGDGTEVDDAGVAAADTGDGREVDDPGVAAADTDDRGSGAALGPSGAGGAGGDEVPPGGARRGRGPGRPRRRWLERRVVVPALVAVVSLSVAAVLTFPGRSGGDGGGDAAPLPSMPPTSLDTGGLDVPTPDGWTAAPVPRLGFGIALPPDWEAVVLSDEMLSSLSRSDPQVTGFVESAHAAAQDGWMFYAAGEDGQGRVTDLKLRAAGTGIDDTAGLEDYARGLVARSGLRDFTVERVTDADRPTVRVRFRSVAESPDGEQVTTFGVETHVVGPDDIVWSLMVTSEDRDVLDDLAPRIVDTLTLQGRADR